MDTSAADLTHTLGLGDLPALASRKVGLLDLRVLGASHQVKIGSWTETVACLPGVPGRLPAFSAQRGYTFAAWTHSYDRQELAAEAEAIRRRVLRHINGLLVLFKGDPLALTGLTASVNQEGASWHTWHVYPQASQIVETQSSFTGLG